MAVAKNTGTDKKPGGLQTLVVMLGMTVVIATGGAFLGMTLGKRMTGASKPDETPPIEDAHARPEGIAEAAHEKAPKHQTAHKPGKTVLKELAPIVTNLSDGNSSWIRLQVAIVYDPEALAHPDVLTTQLTADIVAYLRSVSLRSIEGGAGLRRLNEELAERATIRSEGAVQELIIQSLVVQ
jgi:flagellar protein FliL